MAKIILYCADSNGLTLGPGNKGTDQVIQFSDHYAELDDSAASFSEQMSWVNTRGCPHIEIVTEAEQVTLRAVAKAIHNHEREAWGFEPD
jgi:hypothetical protein